MGAWWAVAFSARVLGPPSRETEEREKDKDDQIQERDFWEGERVRGAADELSGERPPLDLSGDEHSRHVCPVHFSIFINSVFPHYSPNHLH